MNRFFAKAKPPSAARGLPATHPAALSWEDIVQGVYQGLLDRPAEATAIEANVGRFERGEATVAGLIHEIVGSQEFASRVGLYMRRHGSPEHMPFTIDVSQYGEIGMIVRILVNEGVRSRYVVDLGARGLERSNSYDLLKAFGWRGLLVEANPELIPHLARDFAGLDIQIACCAVSDYTGRASFTIGANDDVSSLIEVAAARWGDPRGRVEVDVRRLPDILAEFGAPAEIGLLSIDVEGEDLQVLNDLTAHGGYRVEWVIVEASYDFSVKSLDDLATSAEVRELYEIAAQTSANLILRRRS